VRKVNGISVWHWTLVHALSGLFIGHMLGHLVRLIP
jgi:hypothetical protein